MTTKKIVAIAVGVVVLLILLGVILAACGPGKKSSTRYAQPLCVDRVTQIRVNDWECQSNSSRYMPWYLTSGQAVPAMGVKPSYGGTSVPKGYSIPTTTKATSPAAAPSTTKPSSTPTTKPSSAAPTTTSKPTSNAPTTTPKVNMQKTTTKAPAAAPKTQPKPAAPKPTK